MMPCESIRVLDVALAWRRVRKPIAIIPVVALFILVLPAVYVTAGERVVTDAFDRKVTIDSAERIMALGPDVSEIAFALGVGERIVAVDRSSRYPEAATEKPNVGYRRALSVEGLLSLNPDLILAAQDIGPPEVVEALKSLPISVVFIPEDNSLPGIRRKIALLASALDRGPAGEALSDTVSADFEAAAELAQRIPENARKKVVFFHGLTRLTAAGRDTAADAIIAYAGAKNPFSGIKGYKAASEEIILDMAPDTILMLSNGHGGPTPDEVFSVPVLQLTPAGKNRSLIILDGPYMLGFGPRTASAIRNLATALYPDILDAEKSE